MNTPHTQYSQQALLQKRLDRLARFTALSSVFVALLLTGVKGWAYFFSSSVALLGAFLDSLLDIAASLVNVVALHYALTPPDHDHRFGHGKLEPIAGLGQSGFIFSSALFLLYKSVEGFVNPAPLLHTLWVGIVACISIALTAGLLLLQRYAIAKTGSLILRSDSLHYKSDLFMNIAVLASALLSHMWPLIDPLLGGMIAVFVGYGALSLAKTSIDQLMDRELPHEEKMHIERILKEDPRVLDFHEIRTRRSGSNSFIQVHLSLDPDLPLRRAHRIGFEVEQKILQYFPKAEIMIHQDPMGHDDHLHSRKFVD